MADKPEKRKRASFLAVQAVYAGGINDELDAQLIEAAGRDSDGSGCSLIGVRERDHSWYFEPDQRKQAEELAGRLRPLPICVDVRLIGANQRIGALSAAL